MADTTQPLVIDGHRYWFVNGRLRPFIAGGDGPDDDPKDDVEKLKAALASERKLKRAAEARAAEAEGKVAGLEKKGKPGDQGGNDGNDVAAEVKELRDELAKERVMRLRAEIAAEKKLTPAQAKRLNGSSREELEADADELLEAFPVSKSDKGDDDGKDDRSGGRPPSRRPAADLKGGSDPDGGQEKVETDPAKLAGSVPRF
jgi:hypothetical protein